MIQEEEKSAVEVSFKAAGFIGVGVMGEPMCRHLAGKSSLRVVALDRNPEPLLRLAEHGVRRAESVAEVMAGADVVFLSLPSGEAVHELAHGAGGLLARARAGQIVVDLSTSSLRTTRALASDFAAHGVSFVDAPVARTRAAAEAGELSVMVGADAPTFERLRPLLATFASDISLCGGVGCGQVVKILNNMLLFQTVVALSEARVIGERAGVDAALLFDTLSKGSADSFALRNHGMKAVLPRKFPLRSFSVKYAQKDLLYGMGLAEQLGVDVEGAQRVNRLFDDAVAAGMGDEYWPVVSRLLEA